MPYVVEDTFRLLRDYAPFVNRKYDRRLFVTQCAHCRVHSLLSFSHLSICVFLFIINALFNAKICMVQCGFGSKLKQSIGKVFPHKIHLPFVCEKRSQIAKHFDRLLLTESVAKR